MKKRIASMLLAVVMVVLSLPVFAFTVVAEKSNYDYSRLYVQNGLVAFVDFSTLDARSYAKNS